MSRKGAPVIQETVSPNLIPMIDIMFLLLLFFMLGADMGQREFEDVHLPKAKTVQNDNTTKTEEMGRLTINVYHQYTNAQHPCATYDHGKVCREPGHWRIGIKGTDYLGDALSAKLAKEAALAPSNDPKNPKKSERRVMIRADESCPYGYVQEVMNTCCKNGIYKVECGAAQPPPPSGAAHRMD